MLIICSEKCNWSVKTRRNNDEKQSPRSGEEVDDGYSQREANDGEKNWSADFVLLCFFVSVVFVI
ncbi:MAG: hypothetical protein RL220_1203 [Bacteroidota bacterium]